MSGSKLQRFDLPPHGFEDEFMRPTGLRLDIPPLAGWGFELHHKQSEDVI